MAAVVVCCCRLPDCKENPGQEKLLRLDWIVCSSLRAKFGLAHNQFSHRIRVVGYGRSYWSAVCGAGRHLGLT